MPSAQNKPYAKAVYFGVAHSSAVVWVAQSCLTLCNPTDYNPPVSSMSPTAAAAAAAKSLQSCPTLCDPIDGSPPVSPVPGILQARTLEWVAISFSNAWKWKVKVKSQAWFIKQEADNTLSRCESGPAPVGVERSVMPSHFILFLFFSWQFLGLNWLLSL